MKKILMAALLAAGSWTALSAQTQVIAHRGYWDCDGSAQNSIAALVKAAEAGAYGSEVEVSITADGVPVVNHDDDIQGHVIETTDYATIKDLKLPNGETLPTLEQYLAKGKETPGIRLVLEIKPHKLEANENRAVEAIVALVSPPRGDAEAPLKAAEDAHLVDSSSQTIDEVLDAIAALVQSVQKDA